MRLFPESRKVETNPFLFQLFSNNEIVLEAPWDWDQYHKQFTSVNYNCNGGRYRLLC
jgi:hypothetical protein